MFIDTHSHLFFEDFNDDIEQVILNAKEASVKKIIVPGTDFKTSKQAIKLAEKFENVFAAVGTHPHDTAGWNPNMVKDFFELAKHHKVVAIGEIGLDYYYDYSPKEKQIEAFRQQLNLAVKLGLPAIIHNRDANKDTMNILREYSKTNLKAQLHCFAGSLKDASELIELGYLISFTGNITFKKADTLRKIVSEIPLENLMIETDAPFMSPVPFRGKRNDPSKIPFIAEKLAELKNVTVDKVAEITTQNAERFFNLKQDHKSVLIYQLGNSLYINITNRCNAKCIFCKRLNNLTLNNFNLKLIKPNEPTAEEYISKIDNPKLYDEIVFCGFGEPTIRWEVIKQIANYVKSNGGKTRLNTNGHGNYINNKNIACEFENLIDTVSISLNSSDRKKYSQIMNIDEHLFDEMISFTIEAKKHSKVIFTAVDIDEININETEKFASNLNVEFRKRNYK